MFLRRSRIVPNVAKGKKPKKKGPDAKKAVPEQENSAETEGLETEASTSSQNQVTNLVSNEDNEAPVADNVGESIAPPPPAPEPTIAPPSRSFLSSQDESASSADEANKKAKTVTLPKFRKYKPRITLGGNKVVHKPTPSSSQAQEVLPQQNAPETQKSITVNDAKNTRIESTQLARPELSVSPSKHLVPAAPHCVPMSTEASSSEDEGVIDPYDPNNPQGPKSDTDRIRHRKNQRIKKTFVGGKPTAMIDYLFYNPKSNPMVRTQTEKVLAPDSSRADEELEDEPDQQDDAMAVPAPQLIFGPDGKMVIDEKSLVIERKEAREGREALYKTPVIESTGYYTAQKRRCVARKKWTDEETVFFYKCLNTVGPDFCLISKYFPGCTRHQIKLKFKLEERRNPLLVDKAFKFKTMFDTAEIDEEFEKIAEKARKDKEEKLKKRQSKGSSAKRGRKPQKKKKGPKGRKDYYLEDSSAEEGEESEIEESEPELGSENDSETQDGEERKPTKEVLRRIKQEPKQGEQKCPRRGVASSSQPVASQSSEAPQETSGTVAYLDIAESSAVAERTLNPSELQVADVECIMNSDSQNNTDIISSKNTASTEKSNSKSNLPSTPTAMSVLAKFLTSQRAKAKNTAATPDTSKNIEQSTNTQVEPPHKTVPPIPQLVPITSSTTSMGPVYTMKISAVSDQSSNSSVPVKTPVTTVNVTGPTKQQAPLNTITCLSSPIPTTCSISRPTSAAVNITNCRLQSPTSEVPNKTNHIIIPTNKPDGSVINIINRAQKPESILGLESPMTNFKFITSPNIINQSEVPTSKSQSSIIDTEQEQSSSTEDPDSPSKRPTVYHTILPTATPGTVLNIISKAQKPETILGPATPIFNSNILKLLCSPSIANVIKSASQRSNQSGATVVRPDHIVTSLDTGKVISSQNPSTSSELNIAKNNLMRTEIVNKSAPSVSKECFPNKVQTAATKQIPNKVSVLKVQVAATVNTVPPLPLAKEVIQAPVVESSDKVTISEKPAVTSNSNNAVLSKKISVVDIPVEPTSDDSHLVSTAKGSDVIKDTKDTSKTSSQLTTQEKPSEIRPAQVQDVVTLPSSAEHTHEIVNTIDSSTVNITSKQDDNFAYGLFADLPETLDSSPTKTPSPVKIPAKVLSFRRPNFKPLINKKIINKDTSLKDSKTVEPSVDTNVVDQGSTLSYVKIPVSLIPAKTQTNVNLLNLNAPLTTSSTDINYLKRSIPTTSALDKLKASVDTPKMTVTSSIIIAPKNTSNTSNSILSKIPSNTSNSILAKIASNSTVSKLPTITTSSIISSPSTSTLSSSSQSLENIIVLPTSTPSTTSKPEKVSRRKAPLIIKIPFEEPCFLTSEQLNEMDKSDSSVENKRGRKRKDSVKMVNSTKCSSSEVKSPPVQEPEVIEVAAESEEEEEHAASENMSVDDESDSERSISEESSDSDAKYLKKPPRPTRSGRLPKAVKPKEAPVDVPIKRKRKRMQQKKTSASAPASPEPHHRPAKKRRASVPDPPTLRPVSPEPASTSEAESSFSEDPPAGGMPAPGSLIVCKSLDPVNNKETYTVFMVPPNAGGTTLEHNPDGSLQKLTVGSSAVAVLPASNSVPMVATSFAPCDLSCGLPMSGATLEMLAHNVVSVEAQPRVPGDNNVNIETQSSVLQDNTVDLEGQDQQATDSKLTL